MGDLVEFSCRGQVAPERLFHNDACMLGQVRRAETLDDRLEERWRNSQIMRRSSRVAERLFDGCECARVSDPFCSSVQGLLGSPS